jgi:uncharacterized protein (TIGR02996 family)
MNSPYLFPEWEHLLQAVVANPDDDLPRLVAADWLEEHGEPERAEFIRIQIERARSDQPEYAWREKALLNNPLFGPLWALEACPHLVTLQFGAESGSQLRAVGVNGVERITFRRGFPVAVNCHAEEWLNDGYKVLPRQPIETVSLTRCDAVSIERWWASLDRLRMIPTLALDSRSVTLPATLQEQLPLVQILVNGRPAPTLLLADERPGRLQQQMFPGEAMNPANPIVRPAIGDVT